MSPFVLQRVYDDDDDEEDAAADAKHSDGPTFVDPVNNLKEAFTLGQAALKLFFFEDNQDDKFEVPCIYICFFCRARFTTISPFHSGYLQRPSSPLHHRHEELR